MKVTIQMKGYRNYTTFDKEFNDERHLNNWVSLMSRKGYNIIGIFDKDEAANKSTSDYVTAQENAYFDNFCQSNNI